MWRALTRWCVGVAAVAATFVCGRAEAHGFLAVPAARNVQHNSDWCPHCLSAGGAAATSKGRFGVCGDPWAGPRHHEAFGKYATPVRIAGRYRASGDIPVRVVLTANHRGRWSLRLCPLSGAASQATERRELTQACLNAHRLQRSDGHGPFTHVPSEASDFRVSYRLPRGVKCKRCVLQWIYETANSCMPRGIPRAFTSQGLKTCGQPGAPPMEMFVNCADVTIT